MSSKARMLMGYLKNKTKKPFKKAVTKLPSTGEGSAKSNTTKINTPPHIPVPPTRNTDPVRNEWTNGSKVEIYSRTDSKWHKGEIIDIFTDTEGEWLRVKYAGQKVKEIQRFNDCLRPVTVDTNPETVKVCKQKKPKKKPMLSVEHIRSQILHLLQTFEPNKTESINQLMRGYRNKEHELLYILCMKYQQKYTKLQPKTLKNVYRIGPVIGRGGFATVRKCKRKSDGKLFAIKIIEKAKYINDNQLLLLQNEINTMRKLSHSNIIRLYDVFENDLKICLILELCKGKGLFDHIIDNNGKGFAETDAKIIFYHLCVALEYIHSKFIAHRDLKIEDIIFAKKQNFSNGEKSLHSITLIDFGLCGFCENGLNVLNDSVGTPNYVSPEIVNKQKYNTQTDMWSIGVLLYIILSGFQPFHISEKQTVFELYDLIKSANYEPMTCAEWFGVSECAKDLVKKLLQIDPKKRWTATMALRHEWLVDIALVSGYIRNETRNNYLILFSTEIIAGYLY